MYSDFFNNTINLLNDLNNGSEISIELAPDEDGNIDRECPNDNCKTQFKVNVDDWKTLFSDEAVYCPFCGYTSSADNWNTTEQIQNAEKQAVRMIEAKIGNALNLDSRAFNRLQKKNGFIKMSMHYSGTTNYVNLPIEAMEEMEQKIQCRVCGARYAVIGSAFFCPCCGNNSAEQTFNNTIDVVKAKIQHLETIRTEISKISKDDATRTCTSILESCISDLVVAFQRVCECVYPQINGTKTLKRNVFQHLDSGSKLWKEAVGQGYEDWLSLKEMKDINICFQQRHLFQHKDGIVDDEYITKSGDARYFIGQHIIVKREHILNYSNIIKKLGNHILGLLNCFPKKEISN